MKALKRMNEALLPLLGGIIGYGLIVFGIGILFAPDKIRFSVGLLIGIVCAMGMAIHLAMVLNDSVRMGQSTRILAAKSVMRYIVVAVVFFLMMYFQIGDMIAAFIGIFGLKVSAYIQQFIASKKIRRG